MKIKKINFTKKLIFFSVIMGTIFILFLITDIFIPSEKEIENSKQLQIEFCKKLLKENEVTDSLFLVTWREVGVCGNEYEGRNKDFFNQRINLLMEQIRNPYVFTFKEEICDTGNKTVVIGSASYENILSSDSLKFDLTNRKSIEIRHINVGKDTVKFITPQKRYIFIKKNSNWKFEK